MEKRNEALVVIFSIITLGIYYLYWVAKVQEDLKRRTHLGFGGVGTALCHFVPFYWLYYSFALGRRLELLSGKDRAVLYFVLTFLGFGLLVPALAQSQINDILSRESRDAGVDGDEKRDDEYDDNFSRR